MSTGVRRSNGSVQLGAAPLGVHSAPLNRQIGLGPALLEPEVFFAQCGKVSDLVFEIVQEYGGSISAEHGVGLLKKPYLHYSRSEAEIGYMQALKRAFDPNNVMNPGKLFDS